MFAPKSKSDLGMPGPLDGPPKPKGPPQPDESGETPEYEGKEDEGASLMADLLAPLTELGFPDDQAKSTLAAIFTAAGKCLGRGGPEAEQQEPAEPAADDQGQEPEQ